MILSTLVTSQLHFKMCAGLYGHPVYIVVLRAHPIRGGSHKQRNASGEVAAIVIKVLTVRPSGCFKCPIWPKEQFEFETTDLDKSMAVCLAASKSDAVSIACRFRLPP